MRERMFVNRRDDWRPRLLDAMAEQERMAFAYAKADCIFRLGPTCAAMLRDGALHDRIAVLMDLFRGRYTTLAGAYRVLKREGFADPIDLLTSPVGCGFRESEHPSRAFDGDIGAMMQDGHWGFGHIVGANFYPAGLTGMAVLPRSRADRVFEVD